MESDTSHTVAMEEGHQDEQITSGSKNEFVDNPLPVTAENVENVPVSAVHTPQGLTDDASQSLPKQIKRSTTLSEHKERSLDLDKNSKNAKVESRYLSKCDRLEQNALSSNMNELLRREKQDKLDADYQKKLAKIDKSYHKKLARAERIAAKTKDKQQVSSTSSSQSSTHALNASPIPAEDPKKNRVKTFFSGNGSYSSTYNPPPLNPAIGGGAVVTMMNPVGHCVVSGSCGVGGC